MAEVVPDRIRTAAGTMSSAASEARRHKPDDVRGVAEALPGSSSAPLATTLATTWGKRFGDWATDVESHAGSMRTAADHWGDVDAATRARMERQARMMDGAN